MGRFFKALVCLAIVLSVYAPLTPAPLQATTSAKYVLVFQGDGMGPQHVRAGGMYTNGAAGSLVFESFTNQTTMTHNNVSNGTTDSAASATAMATGVKVNNGVISVRLPGDGSDMTTVLELHKAQGRSTGLVTESYLTDASPAAYGAHDSSRNNYANISSDYLNQTQPNILFGGGGNGFDTAMAQTMGYALVTNRTALLSLDTETQTRVAGSFGTGLILPDGMAGRDASLPTLPEMTQQALAILDNDPDGFFAFIEHEGIDEYSHANNAEGLVKSMKELNSAVQKAIDWVNDPTNGADWSNTLIVVLADHETGGLTVTETNPQAGVIPSMTWSSTGHTQTPVRVFAQGAGADQITGAQIDNTNIFGIVGPAGAITCTSVTLTTGIDTWMDAAAPTTTHGADAKLIADGSPDNGVLIQWDLSTIPAGSTINAATLTFYLPDSNDQSSSVYEFYASRRNWSEANATWSNFDAGSAWGTAGAQNTATDRYTTVLAMSPTGGTPPTQLSSSLNVDGLTQLQRWVDGIDPNYGFVLQDYADSTSDGFRFNSFNSTNPPRLAVTYCPPSGTPTPTIPPTATPTPTEPATATPTPTDTPTGATMVAFQNGVAPDGGYAGMDDTVISQANPTTNYGADPAGLVDGDDPVGSANDLSSLLHWDLTAIPPGSTVNSAAITLNVTNISASAYPVYELRRGWLEGEATWNDASSGNSWAIPGAAGESDRSAVVLGNLTANAVGPAQITLNAAGVAVVQSWVNDPAVNFGLILADTAFTDGADWDASEAATAANRPQLVINYTPPVATATPTPTDMPAPTDTPTDMPTPTDTPTDMPTPTDTPTDMPTPTFTPTPTNTPVSSVQFYLGSSTSGTSGGISFADEDILVNDMTTGAWTLFFDGSDVGLANTDVDAFELQPDGSLLLSFDTAFTLANFGAVDDSDILRFVPTSTGGATAGTWQWYFDGSDVGLSTSDEDVDAFGLLSDGRLLISTLGSVAVTGASGADEDLLAFAPTQLGATTSGAWSLYFDGSDVGLSSTSSEDVNGVWIDAAGKIYLTTLGSFSVTGVSGDGSDLFVCTPGSLGSTTTCTYAMVWDGSANGFSGEVTDSVGIVQ